MGWQKLADGELLDAAAGSIDVLITVDAGMRYQQIISGLPLSVVVLRAGSNRVGHLARLIPALTRTLKDITPGEVREVSE